MLDNKERVTVAFRVDGDPEGLIEHLHALRFGRDLYCLDNSPFYAYGVSFADIVYAPSRDGVPTFSRVTKHRGHSTYRVRLPVGQAHEAFLAHWRDLAQLNCTFEGSGVSPRRLYTIDVPPGADVRSVYALLASGEAAGWWEFEEAHYCEPSSTKPSM